MNFHFISIRNKLYVVREKLAVCLLVWLVFGGGINFFTIKTGLGSFAENTHVVRLCSIERRSLIVVRVG